VKGAYGDLGHDGGDEQDGKDAGAEEVAQLQGHGHGVAAGFAEGGGQDFKDPKEQGDGGNFAQGVRFGHGQGLSTRVGVARFKPESGRVGYPDQIHFGNCTVVSMTFLCSSFSSLGVITTWQ